MKDKKKDNEACEYLVKRAKRNDNILGMLLMVVGFAWVFYFLWSLPYFSLGFLPTILQLCMFCGIAAVAFVPFIVCVDIAIKYFLD